MSYRFRQSRTRGVSTGLLIAAVFVLGVFVGWSSKQAAAHYVKVVTEEHTYGGSFTDIIIHGHAEVLRVGQSVDVYVRD